MGGLDSKGYPQCRKQFEEAQNQTMDIEQARKRKWKFAGELHSGDGEQKWTHLALRWDPQMHSDALRPTARRKPTRPNLRWTDELRTFVKEHVLPQQEWNDVCPNPDFWKMHESRFIDRIEN